MKNVQLIILFVIYFFTSYAEPKSQDWGVYKVRGTPVVINAGTDTFVPGKVINQVICKSDANQSYALYIPVDGGSKILPVIYFFDPHGDGALPVNKYKALADKYGIILVGSNNSKNGNDWSNTENIWRVLSDDCKKRLRINSRQIYVCGFSGGAKVAGHIALNDSKVKSVIANGAGLPDGIRAATFNFSFTAIAGEGDMNMTDLAAFNNDLDKTRTRHRIIFFNGIHEWAPASVMDIAFAGLQLEAMYKKVNARDDASINNYIYESKKRLNKYLVTNDLVKAERECKLSISMLDELTSDVNWFKEKEASINGNPAYQAQWQAQQNLFITEQGLKTGYMQQFNRGNVNYWKTTIMDLQAKARIQTAEGAMYRRLQAYLSLAFYSLSNRFIATDRTIEAQYFINLYKLVDPANSEAWYLSAIINARNNKTQAVEEDLQAAVKLGFNDRTRMLQQPDFRKLTTKVDLLKIENKMNKNR